jgi:hypothetical protein
MKFRLLLSAALLAFGLTSLATAQVTGKVTLEGEPPELREVDMGAVRDCAALHPDPVYDETVLAGEEGELENVIVFVKAEEGMDLPAETPGEPAVLDQEGCMYQPRVVPMMVGQEFLVKNSDPFLHNVNAQPRQNPAFNIAQPNIDPGRSVPSPRVPETFRVRCDVHPWMLAWVRAFDHPFFARTGEDGTFEISVEDLPDGEYTFVAWHERYGEQEQTVEISDGKGEVNFTFDAAAAVAPMEVRDVILASMRTEDGATCGGGSGCGGGDTGGDKGADESGCTTKSCCGDKGDDKGGDKGDDKAAE